MSGWRAAIGGAQRFTLVTVLALSACSPALNWREVHLNRLAALLPCKPDHARRVLVLAAQEVGMEMAGCEAGGGLFAISHLRVGATDQVPEVLAAWRAGTLGNMQSTAVTVLPWRPVAGAVVPEPPSVLLEAAGKRADGSPLQAQLAWIVDGDDVFHIAVYATRLTLDMTETLFSEPKLQ